jgi:hypothetical protein
MPTDDKFSDGMYAGGAVRRAGGGAGAASETTMVGAPECEIWFRLSDHDTDVTAVQAI